MRILELRVENFNTIKSISLEEEDLKRIVVITGEHGNGKSSLLDALVYALTGYLEETISSYIRLGEEQFTVFCKIEDSSGVQYDMLIEAKEGKTDKVLKISTEEDVYRDSDATKRLAEVFNPTLMLYSAVARQHNNTGVLFESDTERLKKLKKIFRITDVDDAIEKMKQDEASLKEEVKLLKKEIEVKTQQYESITLQKVPVLEVSEEEITKEELFWSQEKEKSQNFLLEKQKYEQRLSLYNSKVKEKTSLEEEIQYIQTSLDNLPKIKRFRPLQLEDQISEVKQTLENLNKDLDNCQMDLVHDAASVSEAASLRKQHEELLKNLQDTKKEIEEVRQRINNTESSVSLIDLTKEQESLSQRLTFLKLKKDSHESGNCLVCNHEITEAPEDTDKDIDDLKTRILNIKAQIEEWHKKKSENTSLLSKEKDLGKTCISIENKITEISSNPVLEYVSQEELFQSRLNTVSSSINSQREKLQDLEFQQRESDSVKEQNEQISKQRSSLEERLSLKQEELNNFVIEVPEPFSLQDIVFDSSGYSAFQQRKNKYVEDVSRIKSIEELNQSLKKQKESLGKDIENNQVSLNEKSDHLDSISAGRKLLEKKFTAYLLKRGSEFICHKMNEYFGKSFMNGTLGDEYEIILDVKGNSVQFFYTIGDHDKLLTIRKASGQQKMAISLAFRNALSQLSTFGGFFILDEVDESANDNAAMKMYEILLEDDVSQLITITHNEATRTMFRENPEAVIYEIKKGELIKI